MIYLKKLEKSDWSLLIFLFILSLIPLTFLLPIPLALLYAFCYVFCMYILFALDYNLKKKDEKNG